MIPKKIQIKNFLSYGQELQTIDFAPYHLLCLSGKNGHGKSALLDAITWAIWGQARKTSGTIKADHGLLRLGQTHMLVIIDFTCNNALYRIRREFALTHGKPYAALDFGIIQEDGTIAPLTEKKIRETQKKIEQTIHLDYDSFINSAFLRQGHANEFSKKSAKERKEILANILGLQRYEGMRKAANDKAREAVTKKQQLQAHQEKIETELAKQEAITNAIVKIKADRTELERKDKVLISEQKEVQKKREELFKNQQVYKQAKQACTDIELQQQKLQEKLRELVQKWRSTHRTIINADSADTLKQQKQTITERIQKFQEAHAKKLEQKELLLKAKEAFNEVAQKLKAEQQTKMHKKQLELHQLKLHLKQQDQHIDTTQKEIKKIKAEQATIVQTIKELDAKQKQFNKERIRIHEKQFEKRRTYYQQWISQANYVKRELDHIVQKVSFVQDDASPSCPLCEQNLSASRKKFLKTKLTSNQRFLTHRYERLKKLINTLKTTLITQHKELEAFKKEEADHQLAQHKKLEAEKKNSQLQTQLKELHEQLHIHEKKKAELEAQEKNETAACKQEEEQTHKFIMQDKTYKTKQQECMQLEKAYNFIAYDPQAHKKATEHLQHIEKQLQLLESIEKERHIQPERKQQVYELCIQLKQLKQQLGQHKKNKTYYADLIHNAQSIEDQDRILQQKQQEHAKKKETLLQEQGRLEQQKETLKHLKKEHTEQQKTIKQLAQSAEEFQIVATALGKNGIQALLIEDAIPEIEQEANDLLGRLTDNQAQIFIESLRDLKRGGTRETLDIKISDAAGIRSYELFSGGEAFRIDFALRIAISKLLARRAGTSLQTLIIDEGFGSQDEEGLSHIMDAIYRIQDDFKKVIIVSHLPRLKDQFPVHFFVQKGPNGSHVDVIEQA